MEFLYSYYIMLLASFFLGRYGYCYIIPISASIDYALHDCWSITQLLYLLLLLRLWIINRRVRIQKMTLTLSLRKQNLLRVSQNGAMRSLSVDFEDSLRNFDLLCKDMIGAFRYLRNSDQSVEKSIAILAECQSWSHQHACIGSLNFSTGFRYLRDVFSFQEKKEHRNLRRSTRFIFLALSACDSVISLKTSLPSEIRSIKAKFLFKF